MPKIQNGLRPVNHAKNKKLFFFQISLRAKREKKGRITPSLWMNGVMTTYDKAALI